MPGTLTTGRQIIDADRHVWYEYNRGTGRFELYINSQLVMACDVNGLEVGGEKVLAGSPVPFVADPTGGETVDDEARAAIVDLRDALVAFGIMEAGEGEGEE